MQNKSDIRTRGDVEFLIRSFYEKVMVDETISYLFTEVAQIDLPSHLPKLYDFWCSLLLGESSYKGNPMTVHFHLHAKSPLQKEHFSVWLTLFTATVDELFIGAKAEEAKTRARNTAQLMEYKILSSY